MSDSVSGRKQRDVGAERDSTRKRGSSSSDSSVYKSSAEESVRSKGSKGLSLYSSSDEYFEYICDPCSTAGDKAEAQGYCTNCGEYLCDSCFRGHSRSKASKTHILLDKETMPKKSQISLKQCDPCKTVGEDKEFVGFCTDCKEYLCSNCYISHSKSKSSRQHTLIAKDRLSAKDFDNAITESLVAMGLDTINTKACNEEYIFKRDINVKADTDEKTCYITGMTLVSNTKLVLCDPNNNSLKLVDIESSTIKDILVLQAKPNGITTISNDKVAVVLEDKYQIHIISFKGRPSVAKTIKTNGDCVDVKFANGKLYVSFCNPVKFQILQPTGSIIKTIMPDSEVLRHCILPRHIAIIADESIIYVSDWKTNRVLSMDMNGNMIAMYQGELRMPFDIIVSLCGFVYLCNRDQHVVYKMTSDLSEAAVILGQGDGLSYPQEICLNMDKQNLYISSANKNFIKLYEWK